MSNTKFEIIPIDQLVSCLQKPEKAIAKSWKEGDHVIAYGAMGLSIEINELEIAFLNEDFPNFIEEGGDCIFFLQMIVAQLYKGDIGKIDLTVIKPTASCLILGTEICDQLKKYLYYRKEIDLDELAKTIEMFIYQLCDLVRELGDYATVDFAYEQVKKTVSDKLQVRHEGLKYSDKSAIERKDKSE